MLDDFDKKILHQLQIDCSLSMAELSERVNLATTSCWRRTQKLESDGIIKAKVALLDARALNIRVSVLVEIKTPHHTENWVRCFKQAVQDIPEVVEVYRLSGSVDYILKVIVPTIAAYDDVYQRLTARVELSDVNSRFVMESLKETTALPLSYVI